MQTAAALEGQGEGRRYADSVESLVRNNIQRAKIDMANEVIDAGRFDMQTTTADRKIALETLLQVLPTMLLTSPAAHSQIQCSRTQARPEGTIIGDQGSSMQPHGLRGSRSA